MQVDCGGKDEGPSASALASASASTTTLAKAHTLTIFRAQAAASLLLKLISRDLGTAKVQQGIPILLAMITQGSG